MGVAVGVDVVGGNIRGVDAFYAGFGEGEEFAGIRAAVAVGIFSNSELGIGGIGRVDLAVAIAIEFGQCFKTMGGFAAVGEQRFGAE